MSKPVIPPLQGEFPLHKMLGVSPEITRSEFMVIVNQKDDLTNKLKALKPLLKDIGVDIDSAEKQQNTQINIHLTSPRSPELLAAEYEIIPPKEIATSQPQSS